MVPWATRHRGNSTVATHPAGSRSGGTRSAWRVTDAGSETSNYDREPYPWKRWRLFPRTEAGCAICVEPLQAI
jgi:hypothetical protein